MTPPDSGEVKWINVKDYGAGSGEREVPEGMVKIPKDEVQRLRKAAADAGVCVLLFSLAQRILAALSAIHDAGYQTLAAELRERVPK